MRNINISRTDIGSPSPFDLARGDQYEGNTLDIDKVDSGISPTPTSIPVPKPVEEPVKPLVTPVEGEENDSEEEEQEDVLPDNAKVKIKTNVPKLLAERLKSDGQLPEDFEVTEKTTAKDVENAYRKHMSENIREEVKNEELEKLKSEGYDERVLKSAQKLHYGVSEQEIKVEEVYTQLGSFEFDSSNDNYEKLSKALFQQYYLDKGLPQKEALVNATRDFDDEDVEALIQERQNYFINRAVDIGEKHKEIVKNAQIAEKTKKEGYIAKANEFLEKRVIDGVTYTKEEMETARKAIFEKSEVIVDEQGRRIRVTPYFKKKYERAKNEEQTFKDMVDFALGYDTKKMADKAKRIAKKGLVDDLNDLIEVDVELTHSTKPPVRRDDSGGGEIQRRAL